MAGTHPCSLQLALLQNFGVVPKVKVLLAYFQCIGPVPEVYGLTMVLPGYYFEVAKLWSWMKLGWSKWVIPGGCLAGGFRNFLVLNALTPLLLIVGMFSLGVMKVAFDLLLTTGY